MCLGLAAAADAATGAGHDLQGREQGRQGREERTGVSTRKPGRQLRAGGSSDRETEARDRGGPRVVRCAASAGPPAAPQAVPLGSTAGLYCSDTVLLYRCTAPRQSRSAPRPPGCAAAGGAHCRCQRPPPLGSAGPAGWHRMAVGMRGMHVPGQAGVCVEVQRCQQAAWSPCMRAM